MINLDMMELIKESDLKKLEEKKLVDIRNQVEHIDNEYKTIHINENSISLEELTTLIENFHKLILQMFSNLRNRSQEDIS